MICGGECGDFNPLLIRCLTECAEYIKTAIHGKANKIGEKNMIIKITRETLSDKLNNLSDKEIFLAEQEEKNVVSLLKTSRNFKWSMTMGKRLCRFQTTRRNF